MKQPRSSSGIEDWMVKTQHTAQVMRLTSSRVRSGFLPSPVRAMTMPLTMKARRQHAQQQPPDLHLHQRQAVGVHQGHEHAAQEVVEGGEEDQGEQARHGGDDLDRAPDVDLFGSAGLPGAASTRLSSIAHEAAGARRPAA